MSDRKQREFWIRECTLIVNDKSNRLDRDWPDLVHVREVTPEDAHQTRTNDPFEERWREKYYDKIDELNKAEAENTRLKEVNALYEEALEVESNVVQASMKKANDSGCDIFLYDRCGAALAKGRAMLGEK